MINKISKNKMSEVLVKLNISGTCEFNFALGWLVKFYLYLLGAVATAAILQLEKIRMI